MLANKAIAFVILLSAMSDNAAAQSWEPVSDPDALSALFADTTMTAKLNGSATATARYNRDGTGELAA